MLKQLSQVNNSKISFYPLYRAPLSVHVQWFFTKYLKYKVKWYLDRCLLNLGLQQTTVGPVLAAQAVLVTETQLPSPLR